MGNNLHTRELLKGGGIAMLYRIVNMVMSYVLMLVIVQAFGKDGIGSYNLVIAWGSLVALLGAFGLNTSLVRFVAAYHAREEHRNIRSLYRATLQLTLPLGILLGAILFFLSDVLATWIYEDASLKVHFMIMAASIPFLVLATINVEFLRGWKLIVWSEFFRNLSITLITWGGTFWALFYFNVSFLPILFYGFGALIAAGVTTILIRNQLRIRCRETNPPPTENFSFRKYLTTSFPMILSAFTQMLNSRSDIIMLGWFHSTALVGVYGVAWKVSMLSEFVISALKTIAMPKISELFWTNRETELRQMLRLSTLLIFLSGIPITLILLLFPEAILRWIGEGFEEGATVLRILALSQFIGATAGLVGAFMNMTGNQKVFVRFVGSATAIHVVLNVILIPYFGMEGAAIGTLISTLIWNIGGAIYIYRKYRIATFLQPFKKPSLHDH